MGLFRDLGERVEKFKQQAEAAADSAAYACADCGAEFATDYEECPECESEAVERGDESDGVEGGDDSEAVQRGDESGGGEPTDG